MATGDLIASLRISGKSWIEIGETLNMHPEAARSTWRRSRTRSRFSKGDSEKLAQVLLKGPKTLDELCELLDRSQSTVLSLITEMSEEGYNIAQTDELVTIPQSISAPEPPPTLFQGTATEISFALVSDTHGGSRCEQVTALHDFVHIAVEEYGIQHIIHTGDIFAGHRVYRGQEEDLYAIGGEEQTEAVANNLPNRKDLAWYLLGGNHDYSFYKASGIDVRRQLSAKGRDDIVLLGYDADELPLLAGIDARLWHPSGGPAYALSYRGQKYAAELAFSELQEVVLGDKITPTVRFILVGHFHTQFYFSQGPIKVIGSGCFEGQTNYLKRKGLVPHIGAHIFKCQVVDGFLHRVMIHDISYKEIEDDWRHRWAARQRPVERKIVPIFSITSDDDSSCAVS